MRPRRSWQRGSIIAAGLAAVILTGIVGYLAFGYGAGAAAAMTLLTLTTVGFSTGRDLSTGPLLFTAGLAVLGVSVFAAILGVLGTAIAEGRLSLFSGGARMQREIDRLSHHFIVCAYGRVGRAVCHDLRAEGAALVVIDSQEDLEADLQRDRLAYLIGSPSSEDVLRRAGIERARGLVCAVDSDAENVYITIVARSISAELLIVARAAEEQSADRLYRAGATRVVSPYVTSGRRMAQLAFRPHVVDFFDIARSGRPDLRLEEVAVPDGSSLVGRRLGEVVGAAVPLVVRRGDGELVANPSRDIVVQAGDLIVVCGETAILRPLDTS